MPTSSRLRRTAAALAVSVAALGGLGACGEDTPTRQTTSPAASSSATAVAAVPSASELTALLRTASDPAVPLGQKTPLVEGGAEAPELFEQITKLKQEKGADIVVTDSAEGDAPGTVLANAVIRQAGQQDINVQAHFVKAGDSWQLRKTFACALVRNAGLQVPASCPPA